MISHLVLRILVTTCAVCFLLASACNNQRAQDAATVSLHSGLGGDASGFKRACGPRDFNFPADHGPHPEYRNEWWYITGNVENSSNEKYGFHVTFFRIASTPVTTQKSTSKWSANEFYMGHFAITAANKQKIKYFERFGRAAAGLAGATLPTARKNSFSNRIWLDDWQLELTDTGSNTEIRLTLTEDDTGLDLLLLAQKPKVLQGKNGYSQKSDDPCNASYYYALTRLAVDGNVTFDGETEPVSGSAWLDREWSSSALSDKQVGWDWFALQMDDGRDIMLYQLRNSDGGVDSHSHAVELDVNGGKNIIPLEGWQVETETWWQSNSGARYPVAGRINLSELGETIVYKPLLENQELDLTVRYWEGAIELFSPEGKKLGRGYMELTGY